MKNSKYIKFYTSIFICMLPYMSSCSVFRGGVYNDPWVAAQAEIVDLRQVELKEARQREKAAKTELDALKSQVKRGY